MSSKWYNGYTLYCEHNRAALRQEYPYKSASEVTALLSRQWRALSESKKLEFSVKAKDSRMVCYIPIKFTIIKIITTRNI